VRFWAAPAVAPFLLTRAQQGELSPTQTWWLATLFSNPVTADRRTRVLALLGHALALQQGCDAGAVYYADKAATLAESLDPTDRVRMWAEGVYMMCLGSDDNKARASLKMRGWIKRLEQQWGRDHPRLVQPLCFAAQLALQAEDFDLAKDFAERAAAIVQKHGGPNDPVMRIPLGVLLTVAQQRENWDEAIRLARRQMELEKANDPSAGTRAELNFLIAARGLAERNKDDEQALLLNEKIVATVEQLVRSGKCPMPEALRTFRQVVISQRRLGRSDSVIATMEQLMALPSFDEQVLPTTRAFCHLTLAEEFVQTGDYAQAREEVRKILALLTESSLAHDYAAGKRLRAQAERCAALGRADLAQELRHCAQQWWPEGATGDTTTTATSTRQQSRVGLPTALTPDDQAVEPPF
jgi:tetratricopeptide (TPR) repeat protein